MNHLYTFYNNVGEREAVKAFMVEALKEIATELSFKGESTLGIKEAKSAIDKSFDRLEELYGKIDVKDIPSPR